MSPEKCPACGSSQFDSPEGIPKPICSACGFVICDGVEPPPEPSSGQQQSDESISWPEFYSVSNETENQVAQGFEHLVDASTELSLSVEAVRAASELFVEAAIGNLADGRSWEQIAAATLCLGARSANTPRPASRIAEATDISDDKLHRTTRLVQQKLEKEYTRNPPRNHIPFLCDDLGLSPAVQTQSDQLLKSCADAFTTTGRNPVGVAAAAVYLAANNGVTQRAVADAAGITQETVRVRTNDIREVAEVTDDD